MPKNKAEIREGKYLKIHEMKFGLAIGLFGAVSMIFVSLLTSANPDSIIWVQLISVFYKGYNLSFLGIVLGTIYGFIDGFVIGWIVAVLYNNLLDHK
jgi:hypothetical protein